MKVRIYITDIEFDALCCLVDLAEAQVLDGEHDHIQSTGRSRRNKSYSQDLRIFRVFENKVFKALKEGK